MDYDKPGCVGWWLILSIWAVPVGFGLGVFVAIADGYMYDQIAKGYFVAIGCAVLCPLTGWFAKKLTILVGENVHF